MMPAIEDLPGYGPMKPIFDAVAREYKMTLIALLESGKSPTAVEARRVCLWLSSKLSLRVKGSEISRVLQLSRSDYRRGVDLIERRRVSDAWLLAVTDRLLTELRSAA
jgi:hypothetical protein